MPLISHLIHPKAVALAQQAGVDEEVLKYPLSAASEPLLAPLQLLKRQAVRGIIIRPSDEKILLMYTERYDDYSFPGGGIDSHESAADALQREMREEAGAAAIDISASFGHVTEYMPTWRSGYDLMFQVSEWFHCHLRENLVANQLETYEVNNGMQVCWIDLADAIAHNRAVMQSKRGTMGISIERETLVMEQLARHNGISS